MCRFGAHYIRLEHSRDISRKEDTCVHFMASELNEMKEHVANTMWH